MNRTTLLNVLVSQISTHLNITATKFELTDFRVRVICAYDGDYELHTDLTILSVKLNEGELINTEELRCIIYAFASLLQCEIMLYRLHENDVLKFGPRKNAVEEHPLNIALHGDNTFSS